MKKEIFIIASIMFSTALVLNASTKQNKEWLPEGSPVDISDYNSSLYPAAVGNSDSKSLNENQVKGQEIYSKWCNACHGVGMPGTDALAIVYKGTDTPAMIEEREDLNKDMVSVFVRYGKHSMPFFRKTEIDNQELRFLGEYLEVSHKYMKK